MRTYKSGSRWAFWRWTYTDTGYITRLHVVETPWGAVCLHWINKPDPEPYLHDHPVSFLSLVLRGGRRGRGRVTREEHRWLNWIRASGWDRHAIRKVEPDTLTLCFMGPKQREWGFHTEAGWMHWKAYNDAKRRGEDPVACLRSMMSSGSA